MISWISNKLTLIAVGFSAIVMLLFAVFRAGSKSKSNEIKAKAAETIIKTVKKGKEIENTNANSGADARRDRLREYTGDPK